jgi:hypothetical protein
LAEHRFSIINMLAHRSVGAKAPTIFQGINSGNDGRKRPLIPFLSQSYAEKQSIRN